MVEGYPAAEDAVIAVRPVRCDPILGGPRSPCSRSQSARRRNRPARRGMPTTRGQRKTVAINKKPSPAAAMMTKTELMSSTNSFTSPSGECFPYCRSKCD
jgi:hypothetical protein